ncbi:MAG: homoserine O-succinyltransferase [archaeon]
MTIILPNNYPGKRELEKRRIVCIDEKTAIREDMRPLKIGIINLMPRADSYEFNLLYPLGRSLIQIEPVWIRLRNHVYGSTDKDYLDSNYRYFNDVVNSKLDGLIISPAPVEDLAFEDVTYWHELEEIMVFAKKNIISTLGLCWGGLALAKHLGVEKQMFKKKLFGVFKIINIAKSHIITGEMDDHFFCPQSRHAGISNKNMQQMNKAGKINLLAYSKEAGYTIFESSDRKFLMHLGHPEYHTTRLIEEYERDIAKGRTDVFCPVNTDVSNPINIWRSHCFEFFSQWLLYIHNELAFNAR